METENPPETLIDQCEAAMNQVVEMRKRYGKACVVYGQRMTQLNLSLTTAKLDALRKSFDRSNRKSNVKADEIQIIQDDFTRFADDEVKFQRRLAEVRKKSDTLLRIVGQMKDKTSAIMNLPLTAEEILRSTQESK